MTIKDAHNEQIKTVSVAGKKLETQMIGAPLRDGQTIVMLHPGLGSIESWKDFPSQLAQRTSCSVLLYSRYGYGRSQPLQEKRAPRYLHDEGEEVLPELLDLFGISRPILYGHSDGGTIALLYAARFPAKPLALVVEAPHVFVEEITIAGLLEVKQLYDSGHLSSRLRRYHTDVDSAFRGWNDIWLDAKFKSWNIESELSSIRCPILAIQGVEDQYGTLEQLYAIEKQTPKTELLVIPQCRHSPHDDQPEIVLSRSEEFLSRLRQQNCLP